MQDTLRGLILDMREEQRRRLERIEDKLDAKADRVVVDGVSSRLLALEQSSASHEDLRDLEARLLSPEKASELVRSAMQTESARGWTSRERVMGVALFVIAVLTLALSVYDRVAGPGT